MLDIETQLNILANLNLTQLCCLHLARLLPEDELNNFKDRKIVWAIEGQVAIEGKNVTLCVGVDSNFFLSLPKVFLRPPNALGFIPHLEEDGYVCYLDSEGLLLNREDPTGILCDAIKKAVDVLQAGVSGRNQSDFMNEFGTYWRQISSKTMLTFLPADDVLRKIFVYTNNKKLELAADEISTVKAYFNTEGQGLDFLTRRTALYIPLKEDTFIIPPRPNHPWSTEEIKTIVRKNLSEDNRRLLQHLGKKWKSEELVILGFPRPRGGITLVGLQFSGVAGGHPLLSGRVQNLPVPINIQRCDPNYLLRRGGGQDEFSNFRVLVVGCGAVGGYVALALVQSGIKHLTLVDPDIFQLENTFRHVLGKKAEGQPKVTALKEEIESKYPYLSINTHQKYIQDAIREGLIDLSSFDLAIFATGNPTVELYANRLLHQLAEKPITVFTWLEPHGIGGHALLTRPGKPGCLQCLFTSATATDTPLQNKSAFAAYGQSFGKDDLGCGSLYTPYTALDAQKTSESAVRLALDALSEREQSNPILSWKGNDNNFVAAGFQVSPRHQLSSDQLHASRYSYINSLCPVCGKQGV
ncbi:E2/UBC family protein [Dolichospermum sp. LEGE 00246]|uniref:ThiF family adenylyltransferase n=1 Tax=Dolichospermum sp. LEGE 00246 TaxID=1828605 RepID=UPI0018801800|nr:E2/UBC family protein [Dolichospermum sp. LEGE 00246]MBE9257419.1 ThiF family adenylyltransferase [Dolichospermum sp. LEGE 00246]